MLMEPQEHEDAFFRYENNVMVRLEGYYLYYEKNPCMQNYMLEKNKELQPEITEQYEDKAVKVSERSSRIRRKRRRRIQLFCFFLWTDCMSGYCCADCGGEFLPELPGAG